MKKVLFILKYRENSDDNGYHQYSHCGLSSGLANSARFVCNMLKDNGVAAVLEHAIDNNCIDKLVTKHKPTHVIIEAYWVVPEKFEVLTKLHPNVIWIIRNHSELPFLASEGIAIDWTCKYVSYKNVIISGNSKRIVCELETIIKHTYPTWSDKMIKNKVWYLPNYYKSDTLPRTKPLPLTNTINIGCFGAIRPLKNQLLQAVAAIKFADIHNKTLIFHINSTRIEGGSTDNTLKNLRALFSHVGNNGHKLIEHAWLDHPHFINLLKTKIDIGMCVSHSETFCIVAADLVTSGIPLVASKEVVWASGFSQANPNSSKNIVKHMNVIWKYPRLIGKLNLIRLNCYCKATIKQWLTHFK